MKLALTRWHNVWLVRQRAYIAATLYDKRRLLVHWRVRLRQKLEMVRRAKFARKYLLLCNAWKMWVYRLDERKRTNTLLVIEAQLLSKYLTSMCLPFHRVSCLKIMLQNGEKLLDECGVTAKCCRNLQLPQTLYVNTITFRPLSHLLGV